MLGGGFTLKLQNTFFFSFLLISLSLFSSEVQSKIYKCQKGKKILYQETPCKDDQRDLKLDNESISKKAKNTVSKDNTGNVRDSMKSYTKKVTRQVRLTELGHEIKKLEYQIEDYQSELEKEIAELKEEMNRSANNLAGATRDQQLATQMTVVRQKYQSKIDLAQSKIESLRTEKENL